KELLDALNAQGSNKLGSVKNSLNNIFLSPTQVDVELVKITPVDLGFKDGVAYGDILNRALGLGLSIAPAEVGPQLRLQYQDQPFNEDIYIAMDPIIDSDKVVAQAVFWLTRFENERILNFANGGLSVLWGGTKQLVFVRSTKIVASQTLAITQQQPGLDIQDDKIMLTAPAELQLIFLWQNAGYNDKAEIAGKGFQCRSVKRGFSVNAGRFPAGEVRMQLTSGVGKVFYTGPASVNPDNTRHAKLIRLSPSSVEVGWEDLEGGGDRDFNDCTVEVRAIPIP
ncbi:MAG: DUF4114 domain-containing protein, partial [Patescibacteria group bacterium]